MPSFYVKSLSRKMCVFNVIECIILVEASLLMASISPHWITSSGEAMSPYSHISLSKTFFQCVVLSRLVAIIA